MAYADSTPGKSPAFQFYPTNFISGTVTFSTEEVGAYILLLCYCWDNGQIPSDVRMLARIARMSPARMRSAWDQHLIHKFEPVSDGYIQPRLEREREKQRLWREKSSNGGRKAQANRNQKPTTLEPPLEPKPQPKSDTPVSSLKSLSSDFSQREATPARAGQFCEWYADTHERLFHVGYFGTNMDYQKAQELCAKFTDQQLRDAALVWFGMDDDFATAGTRSIGKFASRITGCLQAIKARGIA